MLFLKDTTQRGQMALKEYHVYESDFSSLKEMRCEYVKTQELRWNVAVSVSFHLPKPLKLSIMGTRFYPGTRLPSPPSNLISSPAGLLQHRTTSRGLSAPPLSRHGESQQERTGQSLVWLQKPELDHGCIKRTEELDSGCVQKKVMTM